MNSVGDETYVQLTTFTRDGRPKPAPVWIASLGDGRVGFTTGEDSWKVRRVRHTTRVELRVCDYAGRVPAGAAVIAGQATLGGPEDQQMVRAAIAAKYGWQFHLIEGLGAVAKLFGSAAGAGGAAILIETA